MNRTDDRYREHRISRRTRAAKRAKLARRELSAARLAYGA